MRRYQHVSSVSNNGDGYGGAMDRRSTLLQFALALPEAYEDEPWGGDIVAKVNKKIFSFFGNPDSTSMSVKLPDSADEALRIPGSAPTGYGLGRHGWVSVPIAGHEPPVEVLCDWIEESYRAVAPKKLVARLAEDVRGSANDGPP